MPVLLGKVSFGVQACEKQATATDASIVPGKLTEVTAGFVESALRAGGVLPTGMSVKSVSTEPTAVSGLLSTTGRTRVTYAGTPGNAKTPPSSVIVKMQCENEVNRAVALGADNYAMERRVYERLARDMRVATAAVYSIVADDATGNVVFVFEDLSHYENLYAIDQWRTGGCTAGEAACVAEAMGSLHAQYWSWSAPLSDWLPSTSQIEARCPVGLVEQCGERFRESVYWANFTAQEQAAIDLAIARAGDLEAALEGPGPRTLLHNDARADNLFWGHASSPGGVVLLDWQMAGQGVGALDLAWFASTSFLECGAPERRLEEYRRIVEVYWRALVDGGVDADKYTLDAAWRDFMLGLMWSMLVILQAVKLGEPNRVLVAFVNRCAYAMVELGAQDTPCERLLG